MRLLHPVSLCGLAVGSGVGLLIAIVLLFSVGRPIVAFRFLKGGITTLPVWIYTLLHCFWGILLGGALGTVLGDRRCFWQASKYRGCFYALLAAMLGVMYYMFFFGKLYFLVAALLAAMELIALAICTLLFWRGLRFSSFLCGMCFLWAFYRFVFSFFCIFVI